MTIFNIRRCEMDVDFSESLLHKISSRFITEDDMSTFYFRLRDTFRLNIMVLNISCDLNASFKSICKFNSYLIVMTQFIFS